MSRLVVSLLTCLVAGPLVVPTAEASTSDVSAEPTHRVEITALSGASITTWPAYDPDVDRFALRPEGRTDGLTVRVTSSDAAAVITVDGRPAANGEIVELPDADAGAEMNVQVVDSAGTSNQSWLVLSDDSPVLATTTTGEGPAPGLTAVTLRSGSGRTHAMLVDDQGVPSQVVTHPSGAFDLNRQPNGNYSVAVALSEGFFADHVIEEYDESFRQVATHRMIGHPKTDFHDSILLPGGGRILMAYIQAEDGQTDSWLQEVSPAGEVLLDWNSREHMDRVSDPILNALGDYAHLNSMQVMQDGHLLLSFRHLNQVMKIDRRSGEVIWRLGGKRSTFEFADDPLGGPCAQHTARELANGDIQIFDNGSGGVPSPNSALCPTPGDPDAGVSRPASRVTVYRLDEEAGQARLVRSYDVAAFSQFAGSAQRLGAGTLDDNVMVGLNNAVTVPGGSEAPDAIELDAAGQVVWTLSSAGHATYRATKVDAADAVAPGVKIDSPVDGAVLQQGAPVTAAFTCTDTGGSNLDRCDGTTANGASLTTDPGSHRLVVTSTDRAGNSSTRSVGYTVLPAATSSPTTGPTPAPSATPPPPPTTSPEPSPDRTSRADAAIRTANGAWKGRDIYAPRRQRVTVRTRAGITATVHVKVRNSGNGPGRLRIRGTTGPRWVGGRWYAGRQDVTARVQAGTYRTARLIPGRSVRLRLVLRPRAATSGQTAAVRLAARGGGGGPDVVRARLAVR